MKTVRFFFYIIVVLLFYGCSSNKYLTPQKYGAKANGETDCTASIREMLRNMKSGKIHKAKFPDGVYLISDSIIIDFPCRITGSKATIITKDTLIGKYAFKYTLSPKGQFQPNKERSELSLNFKIHGVPVAFHGYNNMYIHDCTISTFTGTDTYYKNTKFWFAIDCDRFFDATFKRIHFDQPVNYKENQFNSADGLHITGLCNNILIDGCDGHTGDDFIALNANENTPGDIYDITIRNCNIGSDTISKNGIRIYGGHKKRNLSISNILIEKCKIKTDNSPCIYITNSANGVFDANNQFLTVKDLTVRNCQFVSPKYELASNDYPSIIRIGGVIGDNLSFENIKGFANSYRLSYFINVLKDNDLKNVKLHKCSMTGRNSLQFEKVNPKVVTHELILNRCKIIKDD